MKTIKKWMSSKPVKCDICRGALDKTFVDGATSMGPWAIMCRNCHLEFGTGTGEGCGQIYDAVTLVKLEG